MIVIEDKFSYATEYNTQFFKSWLESKGYLNAAELK